MNEPAQIKTEPGETKRNGFLDFFRRILSPHGELGTLPERVQKDIKRQEMANEVLARVIQLTVFGIITLFYVVSPKTDANTAFTAVPYVLALYFVFNIFGLFWTLRRDLPNWSIYGSIIIDMGLLMLLIWSFHVQYQQPPSFYLKSPTILYIFIFIAVRALRFQARFVMAAGFAGAVGWLGLTSYVILFDETQDMVTRDYVEYLTTNSILIGAEVDKIITILLVTGIIALALKRGHGLLVSAIRDQTAAHDLSRFFDESVATQIRSSDTVISAGEGVMRDVSILNIDVRGFTTMAAQMPASEVMETLAAFQTRLVPLIQQHGGSIDKFLGDGIMATFGALEESDTHAADSLRSIDTIIEDIAQWHKAPELSRFSTSSVNLAVASGAVAVGAVGGQSRLEFTVIGDAVNISAKLEKHNKALKTVALTTRELLEIAREQGYEPGRKIKIVNSDVDGTGRNYELAVLCKSIN